jgi:Cys-tRNA(Pro)/Cys-tRNA(Cys) deacylase
MAKKKAAAPTTAATAALDSAGISFIPHVYQHDQTVSEFGAEAAEVLGVDPERVFKTLMVDTDAGLGIGVVPVSGMLDLKALAQALGGKRAAMADRSVAERKSGYVVGGISPFGQKTPLPTILDDSAILFDTIFVSGGRRGYDLELTPADFLAATGGRLTQIRRE